jgi:hypothetical protein
MFTGSFRKYLARLFFYAFILSVSSIQSHAVDNPVVADIVENKACIQCHEKDNPQLINDWRSSAHASTQPVTDCIACHGDSHQRVAVSARGDSVCIDCHGGKKAPVVHSYITSKHGVIMRLEQNTYDWQQPFMMANYRVPGCGYCHLHQAGHNVSKLVRSDLMDLKAINNIKIQMYPLCQDCHAPRYITRLLDNGEEALGIARKKIREADQLIAWASASFSDKELTSARKIMKNMRHNLRNTYLGAAHQSPDYQWWYGQAALDGDLLRIKGAISELHRNKQQIKQR